MTIQTLDQLVSAIGSNASPLFVDKASIANAAAGQFHSLWRATGQPGQAAIPVASAVCDNTTLGAIGFTQQIAPARSYLGLIEAMCSNSGTTLEIHDRLAHMGGLNGTLTTAQTVNLDLNALLATGNLAARKGPATFGAVQWWLEWYADTGATASNATVGVTYSDGTSGNLTAIALAATRRASQMIPLNRMIPAGVVGKYIRDVDTVTLSASTATAGNFGVTATRYCGGIYQPLANAAFDRDWQHLGLPEIANSACLSMIQIASTTSTGIVRATGKIPHG